MKFRLRPWQLEDVDSLAEHANNFKIANNLTNKFPHPYTHENAEDFIRMTMLHEPRQILAIEVGGKAVGSIGLHPLDDIFIRNIEIGYWIGETYWGKGIVSNAVRQMTAYGFRNFEVERIFARAFGSNVASQRVLEKAGFLLEAKFKQTIYKNGRYEDELVYAIRR